METAKNVPALTDDLSERFGKRGNKDPYLCTLITVAAGFACEVYTYRHDDADDEYQIIPISTPWDERREEFWTYHLRNKRQWFDTPAAAGAGFIQSLREWLQGD